MVGGGCPLLWTPLHLLPRTALLLGLPLSLTLGLIGIPSSALLQWKLILANQSKTPSGESDGLFLGQCELGFLPPGTKMSATKHNAVLGKIKLAVTPSSWRACRNWGSSLKLQAPPPQSETCINSLPPQELTVDTQLIFLLCVC